MSKYAARFLTTFCMAFFVASTSVAFAQFIDMANRAPRSANAIVILNVEKIKQSDRAIRENWSEKMEMAFESGMTPIPPKAERYVLASEIDYEFIKPLWQAAIIDFAKAPSMKQVAKTAGGTADVIGDSPAVLLPNDAYALKIGPQSLGVLSPANRQQAARWLRQLGGGGPSLSPYLKKAAGYSENVGTDVIMAFDLDGAFPPALVEKYLGKMKEIDSFKPNLSQVAKLLAGAQGLRFGFRIGDKMFGKMTLDLSDDPAMTEPYAKTMLLKMMSDAGIRVDDMDSWKLTVKDNTLSLSGDISNGGLRKLLSVVDAPASLDSEETPDSAASAKSAGETTPYDGKSTLAYFRSVDKLLQDLKGDLRDMKTAGQGAVWFDNFARKIERLPMLKVDPDMLDYGAFVVDSLRTAAFNTRNTNIQAGAQQYQVSVDSYSYGGYGYSRGAFGGGWYGPELSDNNAAADATREAGRQKRVIRTQARADIAGDVNSVKTNIAKANADVRRKMTQRYQIEF